MASCSFENMVRAHSGAVQAFARAHTSDPWLAEEAAHVTFVRAWKYRESFRGEGSYEGWLLRICRNVIADLAAKSCREESIDEVELLPAATEEDHGPGAAEIEAALAEVSDTLRGALMLCGALGYDYGSAAEMLDVPVGTVRSRVHRGRAALSSALDRQQPVAA